MTKNQYEPSFIVIALTFTIQPKKNNMIKFSVSLLCNIGPTYLFLIRAWVMDEGNETEIAANGSKYEANI